MEDRQWTVLQTFMTCVVCDAHCRNRSCLGMSCCGMPSLHSLCDLPLGQPSSHTHAAWHVRDSTWLVVSFKRLLQGNHISQLVCLNPGLLCLPHVLLHLHRSVCGTFMYTLGTTWPWSTLYNTFSLTRESECELEC